MINYHEKYGKVKLSKGLKLYHTSESNEINKEKKLNDNSFFTIPPHIWTSNDYLYEFKLKKDLELILIIKNETIEKDNKYFEKNKIRDYCVIAEIHNEIFNTNYGKESDVYLKNENKKLFNNLCSYLYDNEYRGLFNYIDGDPGEFEIIIFRPDEFIEFIESIGVNNYNKIPNYNFKEQNTSLMSKKINFEYPHEYKYIGKNTRKILKSIFYYIDKKNNN